MRYRRINEKRDAVCGVCDLCGRDLRGAVLPGQRGERVPGVSGGVRGADTGGLRGDGR